MSEEDWATFWVVIAAFAMVAACTASVAYWANSAAGLWSMLIFVVLRAKFGASHRSETEESTDRL